MTFPNDFRMKNVDWEMFLLFEVLQFVLSVHKTTKHFDLSFAYNDPKILENMPYDVFSVTFLSPLQRS